MGTRTQKLYPIKGSDYAKAKALAGSNCKGVTLYSGNTAVGQQLAQVFKYNLTQIGCDVTVKLFQGFQIYIAAGTKGEPFDAVFAGWFADYADPYDFIDILLNGENIHESNNNNLAYFSNAAVQKQMRAANALTGDKRYAAYQALDLNITKNHAPWAAYENRNTREFVSARIGRLPVPGRARRCQPQHLLHQVGGSEGTFNDGRRGITPAPTHLETP